MQRIQEMPSQDRPRERLLEHGAAALSDSELIAILLRTGIVGKNAVVLASELLTKYKTLTALARASARELAAMKGIGPAKGVQLAAAFGLGSRLARETVMKVKIDSPKLIYELVGAEMHGLRFEVLKLILLDTRYNLIRVEPISSGSLNESIAHPREIFRPALIYSAYAVAVVHNHPSGDPSPSDADTRLTRRLAEAAGILQIKLLDHVIVGAPNGGRQPYYSFKETGVL